MSMHEYGDVSGYSRVNLDEKALSEWRTGLHAANPAQAQALVRRVDELQATLTKLTDAVGGVVGRDVQGLGPLNEAALAAVRVLG